MTRARKTVGRITFLGAGPGDPELLTTRAVAALGSADVVVADPGVPQAI
ncbi:MAG: SAM-dependent methyltransferase, partial [Jatrophihabitans sp.]